MSSLRFAKSIFVSTQQQAGEAIDSPPAHAAKAAPNRLLLRRGVAELIDRAMPLPFLAMLFPRWAAVVFLYQLLCDCSPGRRSVGKWLCRLRVVDTDTAMSCGGWQAITRRMGAAASQTAWCLWMWMPFVLAYELLSIASVLLDPAGRRLEDFVAGTRVVTERAFRRKLKAACTEEQS
ncbi:MAG: RDD family protein [Acidobacteriota bacterium]